MSFDPKTFISFFEERIPFNAHLRMKIELLEKGLCRIRIPFRPEFIGDPYRPAMHGGVISALIDAAGGGAVFSTLNQLAGVSTVDLRVDYLRPGLLEDLVCDATVLRAGNRVAVTSTRVTQGADAAYVTAEGRGVYNILRPER